MLSFLRVIIIFPVLRLLKYFSLISPSKAVELERGINLFLTHPKPFISSPILKLLMHFSLIPNNMIVKGDYVIISYLDNNIIRELYVPYDKESIGGETNMGFRQPPFIPLLVGKREFGKEVYIQEE